MRREPADESEMVSQLLFGECYQVVKEEGGWMQVIAHYDSYTGWIDRNMHNEITEASFNNLKEQPPPVLDSLMMSIERHGAPPQLILAGSSLPGFNKRKHSLEVDKQIFHIRWTFSDFNTGGLNTLPRTVGFFLNAPYLWGGRSVFGCDCSGFVQTIYKIHSIRLLRDASQQAGQGETISSLNDARLGDLAFFADEEGRVYHVGLILSPGEIVHSSGYVHTDRLDETGIFNLITRKYTHKLFTIKRVSGLYSPVN
jgi:hypothetical protein